MPVRDLRDWIARLKGKGELKEVSDEIHWDLEAAAFTAMSNRTGAEALHFLKVKDYPEGYTLASGLLTGPGTLWLGTAEEKKRLPYTRQALLFEMKDEVAYDAYNYMDYIVEILNRARYTLHATELASGPCKENVIPEEEVDLFKFPFPYIHDGDAGRYITWAQLLARDPETGWQEWEVVRAQIHNRNTLICHFIPYGNSFQSIIGGGIYNIYRKYERMGKPMPCCLVIGGPPALLMASYMFIAPGVDRLEVAGGFNQDPITVVKAETSDIMVPTHAEVVIEGEVPPEVRMTEGPYGEHPRGYADPTPQPIIKVKCITHRNNPIIPFIAHGYKVSDDMAILSCMASAEIFRRCWLRAMYVNWVSLPVDWALNVCVVSTKHYYIGYPYHLMRMVFNTRPSRLFDKLIIVEDDVPPLDLKNVMLDFVMKSHPKRDHHILREEAPLPPTAAYATAEDRKKGITGAKYYVDALWPLQWDPADIPTRLEFEICFPEEVQKVVLEKWDKYGIPVKPRVVKRPKMPEFRLLV